MQHRVRYILELELYRIQRRNMVDVLGSPQLVEFVKVVYPAMLEPFAAAFSDPHVDAAGAVEDIFKVLDEILAIGEHQGLSPRSKLQLLYATWVDVEAIGFKIFRNSVLFDFSRWEGVLTWLAHLVTGYGRLEVDMASLHEEVREPTHGVQGPLHCDVVRGTQPGGCFTPSLSHPTAPPSRSSPCRRMCWSCCETSSTMRSRTSARIRTAACPRKWRSCCCASRCHTTRASCCRPSPRSSAPC